MLKKALKVKNTVSLRLIGKPAIYCIPLPEADHVGIVPPKPFAESYRIKHTIGESVHVGEPLIFDPKDERVYVSSHVSGRIKNIVYGPKNILEYIEVEKSPVQVQPTLPKKTLSELKHLTRPELIHMLCTGGLWPIFREFPFKTIPNPDTLPPAIYLSLDQDEPYLPESSVVLNGKADRLEAGITLLKILAQGNVNVGISQKNYRLKSQVRHLVTHELDGDYPANDPGVYLYHNKKSALEHSSWTLHLQDLLRLVTLILDGRIETHHIISVSGPIIIKPQHYNIQIGTSVENVLNHQEELEKSTPKPKNYRSPEALRYIAGGVLTGRTIHKAGYVGIDDHGLTILEDDTPTSFLSFLKPGMDTPSHSKLFVSSIMSNQNYALTTSRNGGRRECITCGDCVSVCPVEILPQVMMQEIEKNNIQEAKKHGLLDCTECGLCSYVCPSKIELTELFKTTRVQVRGL